MRDGVEILLAIQRRIARPPHKTQHVARVDVILSMCQGDERGQDFARAQKRIFMPTRVYVGQAEYALENKRRKPQLNSRPGGNARRKRSAIGNNARDAGHLLRKQAHHERYRSQAMGNHMERGVANVLAHTRDRGGIVVERHVVHREAMHP